jgi:hypothetical protein
MCPTTGLASLLRSASNTIAAIFSRKSITPSPLGEASLAQLAVKFSETLGWFIAYQCTERTRNKRRSDSENALTDIAENAGFGVKRSVYTE